MTEAKFTLGIDPGKHGALAFYEPVSEDLRVYDMPLFKTKVAGKVKETLDIFGLTAIVREMAAFTSRACVELVGAMPKQGVTSCFNFGFAAGAAQTAVAACSVQLVLVRPNIWKKEMRISADKESARREATQLFPMYAGLWPLVKHDGRAEAALLAYYLAKRYTH